jgi:hypothetical protein
MALRKVQYIPMSEKRRKLFVDSKDDDELQSQQQQHDDQQQSSSQAKRDINATSSDAVSAVNTNTHPTPSDNECNDVFGPSSNVSMLDTFKDTSEANVDEVIKGASNYANEARNGNSEIASSMTDGSVNDGTSNGFASDINAAAMCSGGVLHDEVGVNSVGADQNYAFSMNTQTYSKVSLLHYTSSLYLHTHKYSPYVTHTCVDTLSNSCFIASLHTKYNI